MKKNSSKSNNEAVCCGTVGPKRKIKIDKIPPNPTIKNGVKLIYVGIGVAKFKGRKSGLTYFAADHQRFFKVADEDLNQALSKKEFILAP